MFESLFIVDFDPEAVLQQQTLYSIQQVSKELEFIADNVRHSFMVSPVCSMSASWVWLGSTVGPLL